MMLQLRFSLNRTFDEVAMVAVSHDSEKTPGEPKQRDVIAERSATLLAQDIFQGRREVCIDFEGVQYRLRITRRNKLILQK